MDSNLAGANFRMADLHGSVFLLADLTKADLDGERNSKALA
jgi:uncharacterized protein YjbI with pentapeptide repeats